ncbi:MAG: 30S ribosomal protein S4 [Bdellovibrionaceae bacterium]|nr:30S ribosomal protein S4 [Pseudobdellovibrionaceae bacterium]
MATKTRVKPRFKAQRRLGVELPGLGKAGALDRKPYPPGEHGSKRKKYSNYALQLEEKQKILNNYCLREKQLRRFIRDSKTGTSSNWVNSLAGLLERRLDNVVFRLGLAPSIRAARQMINHGHVQVNGKKVDIGSAVLKVGDVISLKNYEHQCYLRAKDNPRMEVPDYLTKETKDNQEIGKVINVPGIEHIPFAFQSGLLTEYYSIRKA